MQQNHPESSTTSRQRWWLGPAAVAIGALAAPLVVYAFGSALMGPYEGSGGLAGFVASVYGAALRGSLASWGLLLSPGLFVLTWWAVARLVRQRAVSP